MGRQHQGMGRPGVRQVPEGSGEQGKMEKTGCKIICGAPTTLAVKGLMMAMMMMMMIMKSVYLYYQVCFVTFQLGRLIRGKRSALTLNRLDDVNAVDIAKTFNLDLSAVQEVFLLCDGECAEQLT